MPGGTRRHLSLLFRVCVAIALTGVFLHYASPARIVGALRSADPRLVLTFVPLTVVCMILAALQLKVLTDCHGMNVGLARIVNINAATEFYNLFLPGIIAGGVMRWYRLSRHNNMRAQALAVIALNRVLNLLALSLVGAGGWLLQEQPASTTAFFWILVSCTAAVALFLFVASHARISVSGRAWAACNRLIPQPLQAKWLKLMHALGEYRQIPPLERVKLGVYLAGWQLSILASTYFFCLALDIDVAIGTLAWIRAMLGLALMLPVTIGGFGVREGGWIYFLGLYGVAPAAAFALSLLTLLRTLFQAMIGVLVEIRALLRPAIPG